MQRDEQIGFVELPAGHDLRKRFEMRRGASVARGGRTGIPGVGGDVVEWHSSAVFVEVAEVASGVWMTLLCGESHPVRGNVVIERNALAFVVEDAQVMLADGVAGIGGKAEPVGGFAEITRGAVSVVVHRSEIGLGDRVVLAGGR